MNVLRAIPGGEGVPPEPNWNLLFADEMDLADAREHWRTIIAELRDAGTLSTGNGHAIKRLVEYRIQHDRAARHVAEHGAVIKSRRSPQGAKSPYWVVAKQAEDVVRALEAELGIAPVRRGKAKKLQKKAAPRAADAYIKAAARPANS